MRFFALLWFWLNRYDLCVYGNVKCGPLLDASQLLETGTFDLNNFTSFNGVITFKTEGIPVGGILEFLVESNSGDQTGRSGNLMFDVILRIEFNSDKAVLSSSFGAKKYGVRELDLMTDLDSLLIFQVLGSDEVADKRRLKVYGNAFQRKVNSYPFSTAFLKAGNLSVYSKIKRIRKTFELAAIDFCSTSYPDILCESNSYDIDPRSEESLVPDNGICVERLVVNSEESRELKCVGFGAPAMNASWSADGADIELLDTGSDVETTYNNCYALVTTRNLTSRGGTPSVREVSCEIWNKNFDFPHRFEIKRFVITFVKKLTDPTTTAINKTAAERAVTNMTEPPTKKVENTSIQSTTKVTLATQEPTTFSSQQTTLTSSYTINYSSISTSNVKNKSSIWDKPAPPPNSTYSVSNDNSTSNLSPNLHNLALSVYILVFLLVSVLVAAFCVISAVALKKRQRRYKVRRVNRKSNAVPKIAPPPVPKSFERQATTSTMVSSSLDENPEIEHIYATVDETQDPAYSYAWTVPPELLRKSDVDIKFVLTPTSSRLSRQSSSWDGYPHSQSTSGTSGYRTYSNTGLCSLEECSQPETLPVILVNGVELELKDEVTNEAAPEFNDDVLRTRRLPSHPHRHTIRSEYISISAPELLHPSMASLKDTGKTSLNEVTE